MLLTGHNKPQRPGSRHKQPKGIGTHNMRELAALVLRHTIIGMAVTDINFHSPAIRIRLQNSARRQGHIRAEKGLQRLQTPKGLVAVGGGETCTLRPPDDDDSYALP